MKYQLAGKAEITAAKQYRHKGKQIHGAPQKVQNKTKNIHVNTSPTMKMEFQVREERFH